MTKTLQRLLLPVKMTSLFLFLVKNWRHETEILTYPQLYSSLWWQGCTLLVWLFSQWNEDALCLFLRIQAVMIKDAMQTYTLTFPSDKHHNICLFLASICCNMECLLISLTESKLLGSKFFLLSCLFHVARCRAHGRHPHNIRWANGGFQFQPLGQPFFVLFKVIHGFLKERDIMTPRDIFHHLLI